MVNLALILMVVLAFEPLARSARILGVFPMWGRSHHRFLQPVMKTLAQAGHEVVVYSPFPHQNPPPKYTDVFLENIKPDSKEMKDFFLAITDFPEYKCIDTHWHLYKLMYKEFIGDPEIIELISKKEEFDIIFTEAVTIQEHVLVLGHIFKAPVIVLQAFFTNNLINSHAGNDLSMSYIPDCCISYSNKMSFYERFFNSFSILRGLYFYYNDQLPTLERIMRHKFPDMPPIDDLARNISLYFVNDHLTAGYSHPRPPNIIPIAGIHFEPLKPLPQDIKQFMDEAKEGVIFFSLGTYVQDELQPKQYFDMYNNVFKKFKQRVLWKTRKENIDGLPANVMTVKWAPQPEILAHPNCVLFITHGGLLSQHEAIHSGVPVIGIPQFYDQHRNVRFYEEQGIGVKVAIKEISEKTMTAAIRQVLLNPSYTENMKKMSQIFKDRPMSPAESVVFWTEYVLRHGGAGHLRPASARLHWYQLVLLDVILSVIVIFIIVIYIIIFTLRKILYAIGGRKVIADSSKKLN